MHHGIANAQRSAQPEHRNVMAIGHRFLPARRRIWQWAAMVSDDHHQRAVPPRFLRRGIQKLSDAGVRVVMRVEELRRLIITLKRRCDRHFKWLVTAECEDGREERMRFTTQIGDGATEHDVIVCAPLRIAFRRWKRLEPGQPIKAAIDQICLHIREGELTAVVVRRVIAGATHVLAELRQARCLGRTRHDRFVRNRRKAAQNRHQSLRAALA